MNVGIIQNKYKNAQTMQNNISPTKIFHFVCIFFKVIYPFPKLTEGHLQQYVHSSLVALLVDAHHFQQK